MSKRTVRQHQAMRDARRAEEARAARVQGRDPEAEEAERAREVQEYVAAQQVARLREQLSHVQGLDRKELLALGAVLLATESDTNARTRVLKLLLDEAARDAQGDGSQARPDLSSPEAIAAAVRRAFGAG